MNFWRSVAGLVEVELTSAAPETTLETIGRRNIELRNVKKRSDLTYTFCISRKDCRAVKGICKRHGDVLKIHRRIGLYWTAKKALSRPVLLVGGSILLVLILWLPSRVFFVQVEGNSRIPAKKILEAADSCGISFGASRREVRSERMKNALLFAVPELQWAGVNTSGCTATISVREKADFGESRKKADIASIVASRDGYILTGTATAGNLLVKPGETVRKGQVLISAYTDCGLSLRAERAEGEIMAQTVRSAEAVMLSQYAKKGDITRVKRKYSLLLRKKRIFLWKDSGIWEGSCGRMYEEYYITLPGGFQLPLAFCVDSYYLCETDIGELPEEDAEIALKAFTHTYLSQHMVAGKILSGVQCVEADEGRYRLKGEYACVEMIGISRQEQIGDTNGKNS